MLLIASEGPGVIEERRAGERRRRGCTHGNLALPPSSPNISLICTSEGGLPAFRGAGLRVHLKIGVRARGSFQEATN